MADFTMRFVRKGRWGVKGPLFVRLDDVIDFLEQATSSDLVEWLKEVRRDY